MVRMSDSVLDSSTGLFIDGCAVPIVISTCKLSYVSHVYKIYEIIRMIFIACRILGVKDIQLTY